MIREYNSRNKEIGMVIEKLFQINGEEDFETICEMLDNIYLNKDGESDENFRHEYSVISGKIRELIEYEEEGVCPFLLPNLVENVGYLYDYVIKLQKPYIRSVFKLKDHIGLEAGRIELVQQLKWEIINSKESLAMQLEDLHCFADQLEGQAKDSKIIIDSLEEQARTSQQDLQKLDELSDKMKDKIDSIQKESITILGIFASIVLSFTAGMVFSSSVLENMDKASPYRIVGIVLLIGMVITNLVSLLLVYIDRIRRVRPEEVVFPGCIKTINICYISGFIADFLAWIVIEKNILSLFCK